MLPRVWFGWVLTLGIKDNSSVGMREANNNVRVYVLGAFVC